MSGSPESVTQAVRVPGDQPDLASALAAGATSIALEGTVAGGLQVSGPVHIQGGRIEGPADGYVLELSGDVQLEGVTIVSAQGKGLKLTGGSPRVTGCTLEVGGLAMAATGDATPVLRNVQVSRCGNGLLCEDTAAPDVDQLVVVSGGSCVLCNNASSGTFRNLGLVGGAFAAVQVSDAARPHFEGVAVAMAQRGAIFIRGTSAPTMEQVVVQQCGLAAVEICDEATPKLSAALLQKASGSGIFVRDQARPTIGGVRIEGCALSGIEVKDTANPTVDGLEVHEPTGSGLHLHGRCTGTYLQISVQSATLAGVEVAEHAQVEI